MISDATCESLDFMVGRAKKDVEVVSTWAFVLDGAMPLSSIGVLDGYMIIS